MALKSYFRRGCFSGFIRGGVALCAELVFFRSARLCWFFLRLAPRCGRREELARTRGLCAGEAFFVGLMLPRGACVCRGIPRRSEKTIENS